jgi:hypothetical protein
MFVSGWWFSASTPALVFISAVNVYTADQPLLTFAMVLRNKAVVAIRSFI